MLLTVLFLLSLQEFQLVQAIPDCNIEDEVALAVSRITKWLINGYKNTKSTDCKDDQVIADCMAGFFGKEPPKCHPEYFPKQSIKDLPACSKLIFEGKFKDIVGNGKSENVKNILEEIEFAPSDLGLNIMDLCYNLDEYIKQRLIASDGGKFQRKMLDEFCSKNKKKCKAVDDFFRNTTKYLEHYLKTFDLFREEKDHKGNYVSAVVNLTLKSGSKYKYFKNDAQLVENFKNCIKEFFAVVAIKLS